MHKTLAEARALAAAVAAADVGSRGIDLVVAPSFTALAAVRETLGEPAVARVGLAAQDVHWEPSGAFTGAVSPDQLRDVGCTHCIVGHSERRQLFGERDEDVRRKVAALLARHIAPIVCVGETLAQREAGETLRVVLGQLEAALDGLGADDVVRLTVAYEPVWAIGTGRNAAPADAQEVHAAIRARLAARIGEGLAAGVRVLYGGSVKPDNAGALLSQPDVDGALVGGASLDAPSFVAIAAAAS